MKDRTMKARDIACASLPVVAAALFDPGACGAQAFQYPPTRRADVVDDYHGTRVADPYRWLEDSQSEETQRWIAAQNAVTTAYLGSLPERHALEQRLTRLWNFPRYSAPVREGNRYFYFRNDGLQDQAVLYAQTSLDAEARVVLDPNGFSEDGTVALTVVAVSPDGRHVGYGTAAGGSDWQEFRVRDLRSGRDLADHIRWVKFSGLSWTKDGRGFFYSRYPEPRSGEQLLEANRFQALHYHALGSSQEADLLIYERPDQPDWGFSGEVTHDGRYVIITVWEGTETRNRLYFIDLKDAARPDLASPVVRLLDEMDAAYGFVGNDGPIFFLRTDLDAPRGRLIAIDTRRPGRQHWRTLVPETEDVLQAAQVVGGRFVASYMTDARSRVRVFGLDGAARGEIGLPAMGSVDQISGRPDRPEMFYSFTSFLYPASIYRYDVATGANSVFRAPTVDFDPGRYETRQVYYTSKDGTRVPLFVTHRRGLALDGSHPTYLYGYGGFNIPITPYFSVPNLVWLELGGVFAVPNLRGGGEYGDAWHRAGTKERKQNVFDDFIAAAEYLVRERYTTPARLAIGGGSNGGLLVGAAMTQRPELFAVAHPDVGVMDMLRFHRFTIGWAWTSDYGSADDPEGFRYLHAYSPLHNLRPGACYPATLVTTADHDDRVVPGHSFKFAAALQAAQGCERPALIRIETRAGHGAGKPTSKQIEEAADVLAFRLRNLGVRGGLEAGDGAP
jgi:prolyl oligopeptidase